MQTSTIRQLNQLNTQFYEKIAESFAETRQQPWPGWQQLVPHLQQLTHLPLQVLDVGCGNGRLASFLAEKLPDKNIEYTGIDASAELLKLTQQRQLPAHVSVQTQIVDLIESLLTDTLDTTKTYDVICVFGVLHHIPSFELRQKLLQKLALQLNEAGILVVTAWNFVTDERLMERKVEPKSIGINTNDLEPNDYFLTWERGGSATRYCHFVDEEEGKKLTQALHLHMVDHYFSDGKGEKQNRYNVMKNSN